MHRSIVKGPQGHQLEINEDGSLQIFHPDGSSMTFDCPGGLWDSLMRPPEPSDTIPLGGDAMLQILDRAREMVQEEHRMDLLRTVDAGVEEIAPAFPIGEDGDYAFPETIDEAEAVRNQVVAEEESRGELQDRDRKRRYIMHAAGLQA